MSNTSTLVRKLDLVDLEILSILTRETLWKQKLYETMGKRSIQTIGRRVDRLQEDNLLTSCITSPDEVKRDLIIAYKTSEKGQTALEQHHVCQSPDCDTVVVDGEDHVHEFTSAADYFDADGAA